MNKPSYTNKPGKLATVEMAIERYKLGRTTLMQLATAEGAVRRIGRAVRIDIETLDRAIDKLYQ